MSNTTTSHLHDRAVACLTALAVGDAIGGSTEGWNSAQIRERWDGWVEDIVDHYFRDDWETAHPVRPLHKGSGHFTDDTIMTHLLAEVYVTTGRHLTAFDAADHLVPLMLEKRIWIPELERETIAMNRLFVAERFLALRLHWAHADPREAGVGNAVNCGAAMYISPVGLVNAGDPERAYAEAIDFAGSHQHSYGREAAGVLAAVIATAAAPGATLDRVLGTAVDVARDGTKPAIEAVLAAAAQHDDWREAIETNDLRNAMRPFDTVADDYQDQGLGARRPSRLHAIEELPLALAFVLITKGDVRQAIFGGVNYGRDSDSIASMAGAIGGALYGTSAVPQDLVERVATASRTDLAQPALDLADAAMGIRRRDLFDQLRKVEDTTLLLDAGVPVTGAVADA